MVEETKKAKLEIVTENSRLLHGTIAEELARDTPNVSSDNADLLKFHGTAHPDCALFAGVAELLRFDAEYKSLNEPATAHA